MSSSKSYAALFALMFVVALVAGYIVASSIHFGAQPVVRLGTPTPTLGSVQAKLVTPSSEGSAISTPAAGTGGAGDSEQPPIPTVVAPTFDSGSAAQATATANPVAGPSSTPTATATATVTPTATMPPYQFVAEGAPVLHPEKGCYVGAVFGYVHDEQGQWLAGVRLRLSDPWGHVFTSASKPAPDNGYYDFILGTSPATWTLVVVDAEGRQISPAVTVQHKEGDPGCWYEVDFRRTRP